MQARQLAKLVGAHGTDIACLILDIRDVEEHTLCHVKGGARPRAMSMRWLDPNASSLYGLSVLVRLHTQVVNTQC